MRIQWLIMVCFCLGMLSCTPPCKDCYQHNHGETQLIKSRCTTCIVNRCDALCDACKFRSAECGMCWQCINFDACRFSVSDQPGYCSNKTSVPTI